MQVVLPDENTRKRVASLSAFGLEDKTIADALLLSQEQVELIKQTPEFQQTYAEKTTERVERAMDVEDGWDAVEEKAIERTLKALEYNTDPRFALQAAAVANRATRRSPAGHKVINATQSNKTVIINLRQTFVKNMQVGVGENSAVLSIEQREDNVLPKKRVDMPSPQKVSDMLKISRGDNERVVSEMDELAELHGIDASLLTEDDDG